MIVSNSVLMIEKQRGKARGKERNMSNDWREPQLKTAPSSKVVTFEFHRGRPAVEREEKRRVKRNLFGEEKGGGKPSMNRKLGAQLKAKKQLFRSNYVPYQGWKLSHHEEGRQVEITEGVSSYVASKHLEPFNRPFQFPVEPSPNLFSLEDDKPRRNSAEFSRTQFPGLGSVQDVSDDRNPFHDFSTSFLPPSSSAVTSTKRRGFVTGESITNLEHYFSSPRRLGYSSSPLRPQIGDIFRDHCLLSISSFQDDKLFCSSYSNIEYSPNIPSSTSICTPMFNWMLENNDWKDASPVRNMDARFMWEDEDIDTDILNMK